MNEKNQIPSLNGGIHLSRIPHKLKQLPYKPIITLAVDKLTQSIIGFSIQETQIAKNFQIHTRQLKATPINYVRNAMARHFAGNPGYFSVDSSPDFSTASYVKAMKKHALQPKLAWDNTVVRTAKIERILADVFLTLSQSLHGNSRPSPKNYSFGELWRKGGHRFPRS
ncbi:hypothetical protein [Pseudomonas sp. SW-3]|uniref:hypothetical protein n=1 Tax=Pseudomonas sp. SW-3 TaxID=147212 RepID=UPI001909ECC7|nr:hypothetical protein [Pseudomonas sp. SW-3]QQO01681.1 hypothetical protein JIO00_14370 [Pseudomonas sp. SW-3]